MAGKDNKSKNSKTTKAANTVSSDVINGNTVGGVPNSMSFPGENSFPVNQSQGSCLQTNYGNFSQPQQYYQMPNQSHNYNFNGSQSSQNVSHQGNPQNMQHANIASGNSQYYGQQNTMQNSRTTMNESYHGQQITAQQNNGMFEMIQQIHQTNLSFLSRLSSIETNVAKLVPIEQEISKVHSDVCLLKDENKSLSDKMLELELSCQTISSMFDGYTESTQQIETSVLNLQKENSCMSEKLEKSNECHLKLKEEIQELKARSMQENLLFYGL